MSIRNDARSCLIKAIHDRKRLDVTPEQLNTLKPSDPDIGTQDGFAWLEILKAGAACMRTKGHPMGNPSQSDADDLLGQLLIESQLYLEKLARSQSSLRFNLSPLLLISGLAIAASSIALIVRDRRSRGK